MEISEKWWTDYVRRLSAISAEAGALMQEYLDENLFDDDYAMIEYAYALATRYGEAAAALACEMYDSVADASGLFLPPAEPAPTATFEETAAAVRGTQKNRRNSVPDTVSRLTKQAAADTTLQNAQRDGAQFAWVPHGDTCPFCMMLASNGWQNMSRKALKNGHAEHIHAHCDCEYAVRFDNTTTIAGYDPDRYYDMYRSAEGSTWEEKVNSMRREQYARNKEYINAQKRVAYERRATEKPIIPTEKFTSYALNPEAAPDKAKAFELALGYTKDNYEELIQQIEQKADIDKCRNRGHNEYGVLYEQVMRINGANGKTASVCTGWIQRNGESKLTLTSAYVTKKKVNQDD